MQMMLQKNTEEPHYEQEEEEEEEEEDQNQNPLGTFGQGEDEEEEQEERDMPQEEQEDGGEPVDDENNPLLYVDVNLGPDRTERIVVFEGETAEALAEKFTKEHSK
jgi:hypothetical protein